MRSETEKLHVEAVPSPGSRFARTADTDSASRSTIFVVTPMFNDWDPARRLLVDLDAVAKNNDDLLSVVVVNDGSTEAGEFQPDFLASLSNIECVEVVNLVSNLGHARAIAVGLAYVAQEKQGAAVVVMDSDGEDCAVDVGRMLKASRDGESRVIVAHRQQRSEGIAFRAFYQLYKLLFRILTGRKISFGNFCLVPWAILKKLVFVPDLWNHLAASLVRSQFQVTQLSTVRGERYSGSSKMNLVSLIQLGLGAIAVDVERVLVRILLALGYFVLLLLTAMMVVSGVRLVTDLAIPGWASNVFGALAILLVQTTVFAILLLFIDLKNRTVAVAVPALHYRDFIAGVVSLKDEINTSEAQS